VIRSALPLAAELFLGFKPRPPRISRVDPSLAPYAHQLARRIADHSHHFKLASRRFAESIVTRQCVQAHLADSAMWLHAWACCLSKLDRDIRSSASDAEMERARSAAIHFMDLADHAIGDCLWRLNHNTDRTMHEAGSLAMRYVDTLPNHDYVIHEASPNARGTGKPPARAGIRQFPGDNAPATDSSGNGHGQSVPQSARLNQ
jgi:acyl-CoA dehydrogenase family member 9